MKTPEEHQSIKDMKRSLNLTNERIAEITGLSVANVKRITSPSCDNWNWLKLAVYVYEQTKKT